MSYDSVLPSDRSGRGMGDSKGRGAGVSSLRSLHRLKEPSQPRPAGSGGAPTPCRLEEVGKSGCLVASVFLHQPGREAPGVTR